MRLIWNACLSVDLPFYASICVSASLFIDQSSCSFVFLSLFSTQFNLKFSQNKHQPKLSVLIFGHLLSLTSGDGECCCIKRKETSIFKCLCCWDGKSVVISLTIFVSIFPDYNLSKETFYLALQPTQIWAKNEQISTPSAQTAITQKLFVWTSLLFLKGVEISFPTRYWVSWSTNEILRFSTHESHRIPKN